MAFPTVPTVAGSRILFQTNTAGGATKTFPSLSSLTKSAGDLLIAICVEYDGNSTNAEFSSWGGSFTELSVGGDNAGTATMAIGVAYKFSTGSETGTFTVTTADTSANDSVMILMSIPGAHASTAPEAGGFSTGTGAAADPASFDPGGWAAEETLWIAVGAGGEDSTTGTFTGVTTAPTNFTGTAASSITADVIGGVNAAVAFRQQNASSQDVGTWTVDTTQARNAALVIAVRGAAVALTASPSDSITPSDALVIDWTADRIPSDTVALADVATPSEVAGGADHTVSVTDGVTLDAAALLDTFTRANEDPLTTNWNGPVYPTLAQLRVVSNQLLPNGSAFGGNWYDAASFGPDSEAYVTLTAKPGNGERVFCYARLQSAGTTSLDGYYVLLTPGAGTDTFDLSVMTDGSGTVLDTDTAIEWAVGDKMMVRCVGSQIEGWRCPASTGVWVKILEATNSVYTGAGHIGLGADPGSTVLDNFGGGTITSRLTMAQGKGVSDSLALADSPTRVATALRTVTDSVSLADTATPTVPGGAESVNPADTLAISDAVNVNWVASRNSASTVALADARTYARGKTLADSVALTDQATPSETGAHAVNPADTVALADARTYARGKAQADSIVVADATTRVKAIAKALTDGVTLTDSTKDAQGVRLGDIVTPADVLARVHTAIRAVTDSVTLADENFRDEGGGAALTASPSDSLSLTDALTITWTADRIPSDTVAISDSLSTGANYAVTPTDSVALDWQVVTEFTRILDSATDTVTISDAFGRVAVYGRTQTDGLNLTDQALDAQGIRLGDIAVIVDALARAVTAARTLTDSVVLADQLAQVVAKARTLTDSVTLADARVFSRAKVQADAVALADVLSRTTVTLRSVADSVALLDSAVPAKAGSGQQPVNDLLALADTFSRLATYTRTVADSISLADARTYARGKSLTDSLTLADARALVQGQANADSVALTDLLARTATYLRTVSDSVALTDAANTSFAGSDSVQVNDLLALVDSLQRAANFNRALADTVALADSFSRLVGRGTTISDSLALADTFARLAAYKRTPAETLSLADLIAFGVPINLADLVTLADAQSIFNGIITIMQDPIYTGRIGYGRNGSNGYGERGEISDTVAGVVEEEVTV